MSCRLTNDQRAASGTCKDKHCFVCRAWERKAKRKVVVVTYTLGEVFADHIKKEKMTNQSLANSLFKHMQGGGDLITDTVEVFDEVAK